MHALMIITVGLGVLGIFCIFGKARAGLPGVVRAAKVFLPVWLVASLINLSVGVLKAGYTVAQELPILLAVFGTPALAALLILRWAQPKA